LFFKFWIARIRPTSDISVNQNKFLKVGGDMVGYPHSPTLFSPFSLSQYENRGWKSRIDEPGALHQNIGRGIERINISGMAG
jgi:hypothetical protein